MCVHDDIKTTDSPSTGSLLKRYHFMPLQNDLNPFLVHVLLFKNTFSYFSTVKIGENVAKTSICIQISDSDLETWLGKVFQDIEGKMSEWFRRSDMHFRFS